MIIDEEKGIKVAESQKEALLENTILTTEKAILSAELELEINNVVLAFLKSKKLK